MGSSTMTLPRLTTLLRMHAFLTKFAPYLEPALNTFRACLPFITVVGLGVVVWRGSRRDEGQTRRRVEVTFEMPSPYTLLCVLGYLTGTLLVLDVRILILLLPFALAGTCNLRLSTLKSTDDGIESETPLKTVSESFHNMTPASSRRPRKLFHFHSNEEADNLLAHKTSPGSCLPTPPATVPRRRHISYEPQTPPTLRTERQSFRTRVSSTPSNEIRTRKSSTNRRHASEIYEENLVPKKEVWDTSFELLLYNLSKSGSRKSSPVQSQPRFNVSSTISPLAPSPLIDSS